MNAASRAGCDSSPVVVPPRLPHTVPPSKRERDQWKSVSTAARAIITGASEGLGLAMAKEFAASGANVAMLARRPDVLEQAVAAVERRRQGRPRRDGFSLRRVEGR